MKRFRWLWLTLESCFKTMAPPIARINCRIKHLFHFKHKKWKYLPDWTKILNIITIDTWRIWCKLSWSYG